MAAGNVFFRDLGNVVGHVLRLWWFLSPGLYSLSSLDRPAGSSRTHPSSRTLADGEPVRDPVRGVPDGDLRDVGRGRPDRRTSPSLAVLLVASTIFLALTTIVFKRLEPNFAKVI